LRTTRRVSIGSRAAGTCGARRDGGGGGGNGWLVCGELPRQRPSAAAAAAAEAEEARQKDLSGRRC